MLQHEQAQKKNRTWMRDFNFKGVEIRHQPTVKKRPKNGFGSQPDILSYHLRFPETSPFLYAMPSNASDLTEVDLRVANTMVL